MARQSLQGTEPNSGCAAVAKEADRLAEWYRIPVRRAITCLERLVSAFAGHLLGTPEVLAPALCRFPMSMLEEALLALPSEAALQLIEEEDLPQLARRVQNVEWLVADDTPYFALDELAGHVATFRSYLLDHRDYIIQTGLPPRSFRECRWLYTNLGRLYDTRTSSSPWPSDEFMTRSRRRKGSDPYTWVKTPSANGIFCGGDIVPCEYHEADYLNGLCQEDADRLEAARDRLFEVKLRAMELLGEAARRRNVGSLWADFLKTLSDAFTPEEVSFLAKMDRFYLGTDALDGGDSEIDDATIPGGLSNWVGTIGHVEKEIGIGTLDRTKAAMPPALFEKLIATDDTSRECRWAYLRVVGTSDKARLDAIMRQMFQRYEREKIFFTEFRQRVKDSLFGEFRLPVSVLVPADVAKWISPLLQERVNELLGTESPTTATSKAVSGKAEQVVARFPSPAGLQWPEVTMEFVSETELTINARGVTKCYNFAQLGFQDWHAKRQVRPNSLWKFFRILAEEHGELSWDTTKAEVFKDQAIKYIQLLRDRLQVVMGLTIPPIPNYNLHKKYKTAFTLHATTLVQNLTESKADDE